MYGWRTVMHRRRISKVASMEPVTCFVSNLPEEFDRVRLKNYFEKFGLVRDVFIPGKRTSKTNRKFSFVRFSTKEEAERVISQTNGLSLDGLRIGVKIAAYSRAINGSRRVERRW
ncbi:Serine/arginine-rich splicing factor sr45, partial [Dionaea muscipula]